MRRLIGRGHNRAQAVLEYAIALAGVIALVYTSLNVWFWLNRTIVERQVAFNNSRLAAGQANTAGKPVNYQRPPISLIGSPNDTGTTDDPGDPGDFPPIEAACDAAKPFAEAANLRRGELQYIAARMDILGIKLQIFGRKMRRVGNDMQTVCPDEDREDECDALQVRMKRLRRRMNRLRTQQLDPLIARQTELTAEYALLAQQAALACTIPDPGTPPPYNPPDYTHNADDPPCPAAQPFYDLAGAAIDQVLSLLEQRNQALQEGRNHEATDLYNQALDVMEEADNYFDQGDEACGITGDEP